MVKYVAVLVNAVLLSFFGFFIDDNVSIESTVPSSVKAGDEFTVELTINKGDISGFAKVQTELTEGLIAESIEAKGGTFSFQDNKMKIIWWQLPTEESFTISYKVKVSPSFTNNILLNGKFSYIVDNERKVVDFTEKTINIESDEEVIAAVTEPESEITEVESTQEETVIEEEEEVVAIETTEETTTATTSNENEDIAVTSRRIISPNSIKPGDEITIEITVFKGALTGFAKIQDEIPVGFEVKENESFGGTFSASGNKVKILWMNLPSDSEFKISYKLIAEKDVNGTFKLENGLFSYVLPTKNDAQKHLLENGAFTVTGEESVTEPDPIVEVTPDPVIEPIEEPVNTPDPVVNVAPPIKGINFKVQICATHQDVDVSYFVKNNNIQENIQMEMHEGWTKFTVGSFPVYKEARDHREVVRSSYNIQGPFVCAYNTGTRITVQEALMLTQQKWYQ